MKNIIKEMPLEIRPRERLAKYGASTLADYELLAIILRTGTKDKSVLELAREIIIKFKDLGHFNELTIAELCSIKGIKEAKAIEILATIELGKRINNYVCQDVYIKSSNDAYCFIKNELENLKEERFVCLYLDLKSKVIASKTIAIGGISSTSLDLKKALKWGIKYSSNYLIFVHNHPSGDPAPSKEDINVTIEAMKIAKEFDFTIVDHIIIGKNKYFSFLDSKIINKTH